MRTLCWTRVSLTLVVLFVILTVFYLATFLNFFFFIFCEKILLGERTLVLSPFLQKKYKCIPWFSPNKNVVEQTKNKFLFFLEKQKNQKRNRNKKVANRKTKTHKRREICKCRKNFINLTLKYYISCDSKIHIKIDSYKMCKTNAPDNFFFKTQLFTSLNRTKPNEIYFCVASQEKRIQSQRFFKSAKSLFCFFFSSKISILPLKLFSEFSTIQTSRKNIYFFPACSQFSFPLSYTYNNFGCPCSSFSRFLARFNSFSKINFYLFSCKAEFCPIGNFVEKNYNAKDVCKVKCYNNMFHNNNSNSLINMEQKQILCNMDTDKENENKKIGVNIYERHSNTNNSYKKEKNYPNYDFLNIEKDKTNFIRQKKILYDKARKIHEEEKVKNLNFVETIDFLVAEGDKNNSGMPKKFDYKLFEIKVYNWWEEKGKFGIPFHRCSTCKSFDFLLYDSSNNAPVSFDNCLLCSSLSSSNNEDNCLTKEKKIDIVGINISNNGTNNKNKIQNKVKKFLDENKEENSKSPFVMVMPPPNVTGKLHLGHAWLFTIQDILTRFNRMLRKGKGVLLLPGTDHAGIATEIIMQDKILKEEKKTKKDLSEEEFLQKTFEFAEENKKHIFNQMKQLGVSADWERQKFTLDMDVQNIVVEAFVKLYEQNLIYIKNQIAMYDTFLNSALADIEVKFVERRIPLFFFKYLIFNSEEEKAENKIKEGKQVNDIIMNQEYIPVCTTRLETIFGDTCIAVHPDDARYKHLIGKRAYLPYPLSTSFNSSCFQDFFNFSFFLSKRGNLSSRFSCSKTTTPNVNNTVDTTYNDCANTKIKSDLKTNFIYIISHPHVDMNFGTGAVKITPAHCSTDLEIWKHYMNNSGDFLNFVPVVIGKDGKMNKNVNKLFRGLDRFDCREKVWEYMKQLDLALKIDTNHSSLVGVSERSGNTIEYILSRQWYLDMQKFKPKAIEAVKTNDIILKPENYKKIWHDMIKNMNDWCLSRQISWGIKIPSWNIYRKTSSYYNFCNFTYENKEKGDYMLNMEPINVSKVIDKTAYRGSKNEFFGKASSVNLLGSKTLTEKNEISIANKEKNEREKEKQKEKQKGEKEEEKGVPKDNDTCATSLEYVTFIVARNESEMIEKLKQFLAKGKNNLSFEETNSAIFNKASQWMEENERISRLNLNEIKLKNKTFFFRREESVLDTWFSSAIWPIAIFGEPCQFLSYNSNISEPYFVSCIDDKNDLEMPKKFVKSTISNFSLNSSLKAKNVSFCCGKNTMNDHFSFPIFQANSSSSRSIHHNSTGNSDTNNITVMNNGVFNYSVNDAVKSGNNSCKNAFSSSSLEISKNNNSVIYNNEINSDYKSNYNGEEFFLNYDTAKLKNSSKGKKTINDLKENLRKDCKLINLDFLKFYPTTLMITGSDILFFWVSKMAMLCHHLTGKYPFNQVFINGILKDKNNQKMSKSKNNVILPTELTEIYGVDALRYTMAVRAFSSIKSSSSQHSSNITALISSNSSSLSSLEGKDLSFSYEAIKTNFKFVHKTWNVARFLYSQINHFLKNTSLCIIEEIQNNFFSEAYIKTLPLVDRYIISKCHELVKNVHSSLKEYEISHAGTWIQNFIYKDLSDWYIGVCSLRNISNNSCGTCEIKCKENFNVSGNDDIKMSNMNDDGFKNKVIVKNVQETNNKFSSLYNSTYRISEGEIINEQSLFNNYAFNGSNKVINSGDHIINNSSITVQTDSSLENRKKTIFDYSDKFYKNISSVAIIDSQVDKNGSAVMSSEIFLYVFLKAIKLLHPYMPFVTETIYNFLRMKLRLNDAALMFSSWPYHSNLYIDYDALIAFSYIQSVIRKIRSLSVNLSLNLKDAVCFNIYVYDRDVMNVMEKERNLIFYLSRLHNHTKISFIYDSSKQRLSNSSGDASSNVFNTDNAMNSTTIAKSNFFNSTKNSEDNCKEEKHNAYKIYGFLNDSVSSCHTINNDNTKFEHNNKCLDDKISKEHFYVEVVKNF